MSERITSLSGLPVDRKIAALPWRMAVRFVARMLEVRRTRGILAELDSRLLKDIGVSRSEAQQEVARAAWDFHPRSHDRHWR